MQSGVEPRTPKGGKGPTPEAEASGFASPRAEKQTGKPRGLPVWDSNLISQGVCQTSASAWPLCLAAIQAEG
jgi:hypothetical protein